MAEQKIWLGAVPTNCDTCDTLIKNKFYDAKTSMGPWANMCPSCFALGPGIGKLGTGLGQEYTKNTQRVFVKTGG